MTDTWKTYDETWHGTKWGYVVVAIVLLIVLSLLGGIFYLIGEGLKGLVQDPSSLFFYAGTTVGLVVIALLIAIKIGLIAMASVTGVINSVHGMLGHIWALFSNIYLLILAVILALILMSAVFFAASSDIQISLTNPLIIAVLVLMLILFFPLAVFLIDLFSYEHE